MTSFCSNLVTVRGLRKHYGGRLVVHDVDLDVSAGEVVSLIGANGAGKTTTVECIQGLRRPDAGAIRVFGLDPFRDADRLRPLIGSQLQESGLPDRLRVGEAVRLFATERATNGEELLQRFGLGGKQRTPFAGLSGGERQRLYLVLALLNRPQLLILDELTQGLDPAARRGVWAAVQQLRDDGTTVLLVTHELTEAEHLSDRVIAMRDGRILDQGTPAELVARHAGWATVRFSWHQQPSAWDLLDGVSNVRTDGVQVTVHGQRRVIAEVGAELLRRGHVPDDLDVDVPDLESALLALLDGEHHLQETS